MTSLVDDSCSAASEFLNSNVILCQIIGLILGGICATFKLIIPGLKLGANTITGTYWKFVLDNQFSKITNSNLQSLFRELRGKINILYGSEEDINSKTLLEIFTKIGNGDFKTEEDYTSYLASLLQTNKISTDIYTDLTQSDVIRSVLDIGNGGLATTLLEGFTFQNGSSSNELDYLLSQLKQILKSFSGDQIPLFLYILSEELFVIPLIKAPYILIPHESDVVQYFKNPQKTLALFSSQPPNSDSILCTSVMDIPNNKKTFVYLTPSVELPDGEKATCPLTTETKISDSSMSQNKINENFDR